MGSFPLAFQVMFLAAAAVIAVIAVWGAFHED